MVERTSNDNDSNPQPGGVQPAERLDRAAILLVESVVHGLVSRGVISVADAVEMVGVAIDVIGEQAYDGGIRQGEAVASLVVLERIRASLAIDLIG